MPNPRTLAVSLDAGQQIDALVYVAAGHVAQPRTLVLAHGAGAGQRHPFIVDFARGLSDRGVEVVTFDFPYIAQGRRVPDRQERLEACYRTVVETVRAQGTSGARTLFIGGKSMGGRIATHIAAAMDDGGHALLGGVVLLGYPLHPPGKPDRLRVAHLSGVRVPMLFVQGTRDPFGSPDELRTHVAALDDVEILPVDDGDHSFKVPKRAGRTTAQIHRDLQATIVAWMER